MKERVTMRALAKRIGCSHVTVSLALRNSPKISSERRDEVQRLAKELGYRPDPMLRQLANYNRNSKNARIQSAIAWINAWEQPEQFFKQSDFRNYFEGAQSKSEELGYHLEAFNIHDLNLTSKRFGNILSARGVRGVLVPPHPTQLEIPLDQCDDFSILRIGFNNPSTRRHLVCSDQFEGGRLAAIGLLEAGYQRIGYVGNRTKEKMLRYHFAAGFQSYRDMHVPKSQQVPPLYFDSPDPVGGRAVCSQWLKDNRVDAVFVAHPQVGRWARELGLKYGRDLGLAGSSVVDSGFDSGIDQRPFEVGEAAVQFLVRLVENNEYGIPKTPHRLLVSPKWIKGSSVDRGR